LLINLRRRVCFHSSKNCFKGLGIFWKLKVYIRNIKKVESKMEGQDKDKILTDYHAQVAANAALTDAARAQLVEDDEDAYFEEMQRNF